MKICVSEHHSISRTSLVTEDDIPRKGVNNLCLGPQADDAKFTQPHSVRRSDKLTPPKGSAGGLPTLQHEARTKKQVGGI